MLLLDSIYINNSGGKILLDFLIEKLEEEKVEVHYLLDERIRGNHPEIVNNKVTYLEASLLNRHKFYKEDKMNFSKLLCFGNLPPTLRLNIPVYTYFHQKLFLNIPRNTPIKQLIILKLKTAIFRFLQKNTDFWMVQTEIVKGDLIKKFTSINHENVLVLPFYSSSIQEENRLHYRKNNFIYVSNASAHKNHVRLIEGFKIFYDKYKIGKLIVTVGPEFEELTALINNLCKDNYPIMNVGFVSRDQLASLYQSSEFIIFPSLTESFGLGLIEGIENGCKVIGADLPYTYAVCKPSVIFDPYSIESIANAFGESITNTVEDTEQVIFNEIDKIIQILK